MSHKFLLLSLVVTSLLLVLFWFFFSMVANDRNKAREQVKQLTSDFEKVQPQISQLKEDKKEIYKALTSCNFLRETENLPIGDINKDLVKAVSSYYKAEAQVHKVLEKYKEE